MLAVTAVVAAALITIASGSLGSDAQQLEVAVHRIEDGERDLGPSLRRNDELGRVSAALDGLTARLAQLEAEQAALDAERAHMLSSISHDLRSPLAALHAALEALAPTAHARGVHVELDAAEHVHVQGNANALGRVIRNLLDNAIRHAPPGSTVQVSVSEQGRPLVAVVDAGEGFPPEFADRAFDRWSRADESRNRETGGVGLGLAIARGLLDAHGGRIWIDPPPGGRVAFELPPAARGPEALAATAG